MKVSSDHFSRVAASYASCRPVYPDQLFDYLAGLVSERRLVWDCGTGTGQATIPLASRFDAVVATDISSAMLALAPRHPRVQYRVAPAEASGLRTSSVDLVTVAQALHWFQLSAFYKEVLRVLVSGGVLAVWSYGNPEIDSPPLQRELHRFYSEVVGPHWPAERRHVEAAYRTLSFPFAELKPPAFAMEETWTLPQLLGYVGTWSATQRYQESVGHDPLPELEQTLRPYWMPGQARRVRWPLTVRVGHRPLRGAGTPR